MFHNLGTKYQIANPGNFLLILTLPMQAPPYVIRDCFIGYRIPDRRSIKPATGVSV